MACSRMERLPRAWGACKHHSKSHGTLRRGSSAEGSTAPYLYLLFEQDPLRQCEWICADDIAVVRGHLYPQFLRETHGRRHDALHVSYIHSSKCLCMMYPPQIKATNTRLSHL